MKFVRTYLLQIGLVFSILYPMGWMAYALYRYALDVPMEDDFDLLFADWWRVQEAAGGWDKLGQLTRQHGFTEHRLAIVRLMAGVTMGVMGYVDTRIFMWLALAVLLALVALFYRTTRQLSMPPLAFLPVVWLMMQPQLLHRNLLWSSTAIIYALLPLLGFLLYSQLVKPGKRSFLMASFLTCLLPWVMGNGILAGLFGIIVLGLQRRWKALVAYAALVLFLGTGYFRGYHSEFTPRQFEGIFTYIRRFLLSLGNYANFDEITTTPHPYWLPIFVGGLTLTGWCIAFFSALSRVVRGIDRTRSNSADQLQLVTIGYGAWLVATLGAIAITRVNMPEGYLLNSRYFDASIPLTCIVYLWNVKTAGPWIRSRLISFALLLSGGLWIWHQYQAVYVLELNHNQQLVSLFHLQHDARWEVYPGDDPYWEAYADSVTNQALVKRQYRPPFSKLNPILATMNMIHARDSVRQHLQLEEHNGNNEVTLSNRTLEVHPGDRIFWVLRSNQRIYLIAASQLPAGRRAYFFSGKRFLPMGVHGTFKPKNFSPQTYQVLITRLNANQLQWYLTDQQVKISR